jgi:hypothetical protein
MCIIYLEVAEPDLTRETRPTRSDPNPTRPDFLRKSNRPDPIWTRPDPTRPDPKSNGLQSNQNLSTIWKNTICKLTRPDLTLTWPGPTRFLLEGQTDPTHPIATSKFTWGEIWLLKLFNFFNIIFTNYI